MQQWIKDSYDLFHKNKLLQLVKKKSSRKHL